MTERLQVKTIIIMWEKDIFLVYIYIYQKISYCINYTHLNAEITKTKKRGYARSRFLL